MTTKSEIYSPQKIIMWFGKPCDRFLWQEVHISRVMIPSLPVSEGEMELFRMEVTIPGRKGCYSK